LARVQFVGPTGGTGPGLGLVPGQPGAVLVELGIQATLVQGHPLTVSGNPSMDLLTPMWRDLASASALYRVQITFSDASLPPGAPLTVSLSYYLSSDKCRGAGSCQLLPPTSFDPLLAPFGHARAVVAMSSSVTLPGGVDQQSRVRVDSSPGLAVGIVPGLGGSALTRTFTVANGATHDFGLSLTGTVAFDGLDYVDANGLASAGNVQTYFDLDYFDTLHIGAIEALDALGQALPGFAITNSFGWTMATTPPVPEPATMLLWLLGAAMLFGRRWLPLALALVGTTVQAQQVGVSGRLTGSLDGVSFDAVEYSQASRTQTQSDGVQAQRNLQDPAVRIDDWAVAGGQSLAHAGFGWVGVQVGAEVDVGVLAGSGSIQASARAQFTDLLTITPANPALLGTWGRFSYTVVLSGIGGVDDASSNGYGEVIYSGLGLPSGGWISSSQGLGRGASIGSPLPVVATFERFTLFGAPTFIEVRLDAELQVLVYEGRVDAYADLMHTAAWGGIASVSTLDGQLLGPDGYALASASGTDYRGAISPVPEPGAWLLLVLGMPLLMRHVGRGRGIRLKQRRITRNHRSRGHGPLTVRGASTSSERSNAVVGGAHGPESGECCRDASTGTIALAAMARYCSWRDDHCERTKQLETKGQVRRQIPALGTCRECAGPFLRDACGTITTALRRWADASPDAGCVSTPPRTWTSPGSHPPA